MSGDRKGKQYSVPELENLEFEFWSIKKESSKNFKQRALSQDGGVGRYASLLRITKRRITTHLKTKNNQNCQKIELHGSLATKELKKHSSGLVGGVEMGSWGHEDVL